MGAYFTLAHGNDSKTQLKQDPKQAEKVWFFRIEFAEFPCLLSLQLAVLIQDPQLFIHAYTYIENKQAVTFDQTKPIILVLEYGPFTDSWYVHGVDGTNIVSVRCPPVSASASLEIPLLAWEGSGDSPKISSLKELSRKLEEANPSFNPAEVTADVNLVYLDDPKIAFGHIDPAEASISDYAGGYMMAYPRSFAAMLNLPGMNITPYEYTGDGSNDGDAVLSTKFKSAHFVLSPTFRFRYESVPTAAQAAGGTPDQCIKFAGTYLEAYDDTQTDGKLLVQIDEAWSMVWQDPGAES